MTSLEFSSADRIGDIVAAQPLTARLFEKVGIDYCCGGKQTLAAACARKNLDPATITAALTTIVQLASAATVVDAAGMSLTELADHIESTHHAYLKEELPRLVEQAERVAYKHGARDSRLAAVATTTRELAEEMISHMAKEERILFPIVRALERGDTGAVHCGSIANPIAQMEHEHASAGDAIGRLRELTDGFTPDTEACNTHRALLAGLAHFEADLHQHVHKENNVLFPRALTLETSLRRLPVSESI